MIGKYTTRGLLPLMLVSVALLLCSCGRETWQFTFQPRDGKACVETEKVTLLFEGVPLAPPSGGACGGARGSLAVSGPGTSSITVTALGKTLTNSYEKGVNTLALDAYQVEIRDGGTRLTVGDLEFDLTSDKKTIVIHEDGTASVRKPE